MYNDLSEECYVFYPKTPIFFKFFTVLVLFVGISFLYSEIVYLVAGNPDNISSNAIYEWMWDNPAELSQYQFDYRLYIYFPVMLVWSVYFIFYLGYQFYFTKLIVGNTGIEYFAWTYHLEAKWENIEKIGKRGFLPTSAKGMFLKPGSYKTNASSPLTNYFFSNKDFISLKYFKKSISPISACELIEKYLTDNENNE